MNYNELEKIASKYILSTTELPQNMTLLAQKLDIKLKNSIECKIDYRTDTTPLSQCNAIFSTFNAENIIYYDERNPYKNMAIASQIAYFILHKEIGEIEHSDLARLAVILLAPATLIKQDKIYSALKLSEICLIPIDDAKNYWNYLKSQKRKFRNKIKKVSFAALTLICCGYTVFSYNAIPANTYTENFDLQEISDNNTISTPDNVWITKSGDKYHLETCIHIQAKNNKIQITTDEAHVLGYEACSVCQ